MEDQQDLHPSGWRSLLFVPILNRAVLEKAASRGADALILDLEDAVAPGQKAEARALAPDAIALLASQGADVLVRINAGLRDQVRDLEACVRPGLKAVVLPKAEVPERLRQVEELLMELEAEAGMPIGQVRIVALVESARGLLAAPELAKASSRIVALALGPEDLALDMGGEPDAELLLEPCRRLVWAARAADCTALGFPGSISNFSDMPRLEHELSLAKRLGLGGALCIHPRQIEAINTAFSVSQADADYARRVVEAFAEAEQEGKGVCSLDGKMIDLPVVLRAREVVARWRQQNSRSTST